MWIPEYIDYKLDCARIKIKRALAGAKKYFKYPGLYLQAYSWEWGDHDHICYAARLMNEKDFNKACPLMQDGGGCIEWDDMCDDCRYHGKVDFYRDKDGNHKVLFLFDNNISADEAYKEARKNEGGV